MTLLEVRTDFVQKSGRYDLVVDAADGNYSDNGADKYINSGMKMLERLSNVEATKAKLYYPLAIGEYSVIFQHNCRSIHEVWVNNTENRWRLTKVELNDLKAYYDSIDDVTTVGQPAYFSLAGLRALETTARDSLGIFLDKTWDEGDANYDYRGIVISPPAEEAFVVEIIGLFKNVVMSNDADENFWTQQEDDLLVRAALYKLEGISRGTENAKNWLSAIRDDVFELDKDVVEEESYGINQIEG